MRLSGRAFAILAALVGLLIIIATDQILPASSAYQAQMRVWLAGRATGVAVYLLLTGQMAFGLILSHPVNKSTWKLSKRLFPWHENLWIFILAFLAAHVVSIIMDPWAGVGIDGSFIPGLSSYRSAPVALGTLALYALIVSGITARYTKLLPPGLWLRLHRFGLVIFALTWIHGMLAGTDSESLQPMYVGTGLLIVGAAAYRYWVSKKRLPSFATSLPDAEIARPPANARQGPAISAAASTIGEAVGATTLEEVGA